MVSLLPIRRVRTRDETLREGLILLHRLQPLSRTAVVRIKHIGVDFTQDLKPRPGVMPCLKMLGKLTVSTELPTHPAFKDGQRVVVFPYSTCAMQDAKEPCANCRRAPAVGNAPSDRAALYALHREHVCLKEWVYGRTIDGALQDFVCVAHPMQQLLAVAALVSLHDCLFLFDVALPFFVLCQDVLSGSDSNVLVVLHDAHKKRNDCLLVLRCLGLGAEKFTFTNMDALGIKRRPFNTCSW